MKLLKLVGEFMSDLPKLDMNNFNKSTEYSRSFELGKVMDNPLSRDLCMDDSTQRERERSDWAEGDPAAKIASLEHRLETSFDELKEKVGILKQTENALHHLEQRLGARTAEYDAVQLTLHRRREELDAKATEIVILEERVKTLEKTLLEEGLVVPDSDKNLTSRRKFSQPVYEEVTVCRSREVQTDWTGENILEREKAKSELENDYETLKIGYKGDKEDWERRIQEMAENLQIKTNLVATLTTRIQTMTDEYESGRESMEKERKDYAKRLEEISAAAGRVPLLEKELQLARDELRIVEYEKLSERQGYEEAIETSLIDGMKSQRNQGEYWKQKLTWAQEQMEDFRREANKGLIIHP